MINRLERLRDEVDMLIYDNCPGESRYFIMHLYGVSQFCALLALKRGLDTELAATAGMLHDIYQITEGVMEDHAKKGAIQAEEILRRSRMYTEDEISVITAAISRHGKKRSVHEPYDEVLKDADVLQHCLYNTDYPVIEKEADRYKNLLIELGCDDE